MLTKVICDHPCSCWRSAEPTVN